MEIYVIPFEGRYLVYRPLIHLAFVANQSLVEKIRQSMDGRPSPARDAADELLEAIGFWRPDSPPPDPGWPAEHRPTQAVLLMTGACNLRCVYCYARGGEDPRLRMSLPLARTVIDQACENARLAGQGFFGLAFHGGGEPTLSWKVMTGAVEHARRKELPCRISMATNGVWGRSQRRFILEHFDELSVSFDGIPSVQNAQRPRPDGSGSFDAVMETLQELDRKRLPYGIRMTAIPESFGELPASVAFLCAETGCRLFQVEPSFSGERGRYAPPGPRQAESFVEAFLAAHQIASDAGRTLFYSGARPWLQTCSFCRAPMEALVVTPEGDVVTCFETCDRRHSLISRFTIGHAAPGSVRIDLERLRSFAADQQSRRTECAGCFCYWHCAGDCGPRRLAEEGSSTRCWINRSLTSALLARSISASGPPRQARTAVNVQRSAKTGTRV